MLILVLTIPKGLSDSIKGCHRSETDFQCGVWLTANTQYGFITIAIFWTCLVYGHNQTHKHNRFSTWNKKNGYGDVGLGPFDFVFFPVCIVCKF